MIKKIISKSNLSNVTYRTSDWWKNRLDDLTPNPRLWFSGAAAALNIEAQLITGKLYFSFTSECSQNNSQDLRSSVREAAPATWQRSERISSG